ncbi:MAG TPA: hypothetical protein VMA30_14470 [Xanthobacteraceae bacterium]|nr:hypothetical protein [Xanthobacteraceae bacterium]
MRKFLLSALVATILSAGPLATRAAAMPLTGVTAAPHALVRMASVVCGGSGCNVVQTKGPKGRKLQWLGHG